MNGIFVFLVENYLGFKSEVIGVGQSSNIAQIDVESNLEYPAKSIECIGLLSPNEYYCMI